MPFLNEKKFEFVQKVLHFLFHHNDSFSPRIQELFFLNNHIPPGPIQNLKLRNNRSNRIRDLSGHTHTLSLQFRVNFLASKLKGTKHNLVTSKTSNKPHHLKCSQRPLGGVAASTNILLQALSLYSMQKHTDTKPRRLHH